MTAEPTCTRCAHHGRRHRWWATRPDGIICPRCHLVERITAALDDGTGHVASAFVPLYRAVCDQPSEVAGLVWLVCNPHVAPLLSALATGRLPLSHESLDAHPSRQTAMHLRDRLVQLGILEYRDRYLVLFENWLRRTLSGIEPEDDRQLVRRFATWHSLRLLRAKAERTGLAPGLVNRHRTEITRAGMFLAWLRENGTTPDQCTQAHLDAWITTGPVARQHSRAFIVWAGQNGTMPRTLHLPYHSKQPRDPASQRERLATLRRLIDPETACHLRDRAAGILLTLFAQPITRIAALPLANLDLRGDEVLIALGDKGPIPVPEPFGQILREHAADRGPYNIEANRDSPWLFPGTAPGQHVHSTYLMNRLSSQGLTLLGMRISALRALVAEMPLAVAAQALGYTAECAQDHAAQAGARWAGYVAHRRQPAR